MIVGNQSRIFIDYYNVRGKIERLRANAFISPGLRLSLLIDIGKHLLRTKDRRWHL